MYIEYICTESTYVLDVVRELLEPVGIHFSVYAQMIRVSDALCEHTQFDVHMYIEYVCTHKGFELVMRCMSTNK
jgi:hypothetical protein